MINYQIIIPAYNAGKTISTVLAQISALDQKPEEIIVIDDGSSDDTAQKCEGQGVRLIRNLMNSGKGYALKVGFEAALKSKTADYVLCMDADLQHPVASIPDFLEEAEKNNSKFIIGSRSRSTIKMPVHRILSNSITSSMISGLSKQKIEDSQCGFRLIHKSILQNLDLVENGFQMESEMIIKAARSGNVIHSVVIPTIYSSEDSHMRNVADTLRFIRLILRESKNQIMGDRLRRGAS